MGKSTKLGFHYLGLTAELEISGFGCFEFANLAFSNASGSTLLWVRAVYSDQSIDQSQERGSDECHISGNV